MTRGFGRCAPAVILCLVSLQLPGTIDSAFAEHLAKRRGRTVTVTRARPLPAPNPSSSLGVFRPTPYVAVRGSFPNGVGYSPLGIYGDQTMSLHGPLSPLRSISAPVVTYVRGYDGQVRLTEGVSSSYPNLPELSPVIYPTQANYYYAPRVIRTPPWWDSAINWIDQN